MNETPPSEPKPSRAVNLYVGLCLAVGIGTILFRILVLGEKEQTSLIVIGLPTALAMITTSLPIFSSIIQMCFDAAGAGNIKPTHHPTMESTD